MKGSSKVAKRYARAVFQACSPDALEATRDALRAFVKAYTENDELHSALINPAISVDARLAIVSDVMKAIAAGNEIALNSLKVFVENGRFSELGGTVEAVTEMIEVWKRMRSVKIISAFKLEQSEQNEMLTEVRNALGSSATVDWAVEPDLIGGLQVMSGDLLLDGSVRTSLEKIRSSLMQ